MLNTYNTIQYNQEWENGNGRIMVGAVNRDSCRKIFTSLKIPPLPSQYIYSLVMFVVNNRDSFTSNTDKYKIVTRNSSNLYFPLTNLTIFQNGSQYFRMVYNNLPGNIKQLSGNKNQFKKAVLQFLYSYSFYSLEEFFKCKDN
jgi:hypothetical protein